MRLAGWRALCPVRRGGECSLSTGYGCFSALEPDTGRLASIAFAFATFLTTSPTFKIRFGFGFWKMATKTTTEKEKNKKPVQFGLVFGIGFVS